MRFLLRLRYAALTRRCRHEVARSHECERWAREALERAEAHASEAIILAARLRLIHFED